MDEIIELLSNNARLTSDEISKLTGKNKSAVSNLIKKYEKNGTIVKYKTVINYDLVQDKGSFVP